MLDDQELSQMIDISLSSIHLSEEEQYLIDLHAAEQNSDNQYIEMTFLSALDCFLASMMLSYTALHVDGTGLCLYAAVIVSVMKKYNTSLAGGDPWRMRTEVIAYAKELQLQQEILSTDLFTNLITGDIFPISCRSQSPINNFNTYLELHEV